MDPSLTRILVVDDEPIVLSALKDQLEKDGFQVVTAPTSLKALDELQRQTFSIVLADEGNGSSKGLDLLARVKEAHPSATRVLIAGTTTVAELLEAVQAGLIHRFLTKPWLHPELIAILQNAVSANLPVGQLASSSLGAAPVPGEGAEAQPERSGDDANERHYTAEEAYVAVETYVQMIGAFHPNLGSTATRCMALCRTAAQLLQLPPNQARSLVWAGALHDIGLIGIERSIVRKWLRAPDGCREEELALIRRHPAEAELMLKPTPIFREAAELLRCHQETWDGTGFPDRLKGEAIPKLSRVLSVAIAFCSKTSGAAQAMSDLEGMKDRAFDPKAVELIAQAVPMTELPRGEREIQITELQAGMILARDIRNSSGMLILAKGKELTTAWVNKVLTIHGTTPLSPDVLVYC